ncbi:MAG: Crp/Fnr family transcriptional regulator [Bacteroidota bacterium]
MIGKLITYFEKYTELGQEEKQFLRDHIPVKLVEKNQLLLWEGEVSSEFFFIIKGCIRMFYWVEGEEKTAFFYTENEFVSSYESFTKHIPARHSLQAAEDTTVAIISSEQAQAMLLKYPKFEFLARVAMEQELSVYQDIIASFITQNAEQRYQALSKSKPQLLQRIPQYQLATYLGVSPETLSRIRKRISNKKLS